MEIRFILRSGVIFLMEDITTDTGIEWMEIRFILRSGVIFPLPDARYNNGYRD
jgi:hypothetical protein